MQLDDYIKTLPTDENTCDSCHDLRWLIVENEDAVYFPWVKDFPDFVPICIQYCGFCLNKHREPDDRLAVKRARRVFEEFCFDDLELKNALDNELYLEFGDLMRDKKEYRDKVKNIYEDMDREK